MNNELRRGERGKVYDSRERMTEEKTDKHKKYLIMKKKDKIITED